MKKILIGYITKNIGAGLNQYIINFVNSIKDDDVEIDLITREKESDLDQIKNVVLKDVKYNKIYKIPTNRTPFKTIKVLKEIMKKGEYDVAYFNVSSAHDNLGLIAAKQCNIERRIIHSHSSSASGSSALKRGIRRVVNAIGKIVLTNTTNTYLACSDKAAKWLFPSNVYNSDSYVIVYNAVDARKFKFDKKIRERIRKELNLKKELLIGHVARFSLDSKNNLFAIDILKETLKSKPDTKLICIGGGDDFEIVKEYAKNQGVIDNIIFTGRINNVEDYLHAIDVFILPSKFEGLPITGVEAQFAGIPCLLSDRITKDVVISKNTKMLPIKDPKVWANEIININNRENELLKMADQFDFNKNDQKEKVFNSKILDLQSVGACNFELIFSFLFMLEGFLQAFNYTVGEKIISFVLWPMTFLGGLILLNRLIRFKQYKLSLRNILLLIFDFTLLISAIIFRQYRLYLNVKFFLLMLFQFGILYLYSNKYDEKKKSNLSILLNLFLLFSSLLVFGSFYTLLANYNQVINTATAAKVFGISAGRLFGVFWDPNIGALISTVAFVISLHKINVTKNMIIRIINVILSLLFALYISLSDSRMGILCLIVSSILYILLTFLSKNSNKKIKICLIIIALISILFVLKGRNTYNKIVAEINRKEAIIEKINNKTKKPNSKITKKKQKEKHIQIERSYDLNKDISNRRFDIWKSGLEIVEKEPVFGIGHANVLSYVKDELPDTYIINNTQSDFSSMHNMFLDVAVSQGIVGLVLYLAFVIPTGILLLKNLKYLINLNTDNILFITIILIELMSSMFITEIIYIDSPMSVIFWICLGQLMNYINFKKKKVQNEK